MNTLILAFALLTPEAQNLKLRREMTGLGYAPDVNVESILEYVRSKRGAQGPIFQDNEKPQQLVLIDKEGMRWTSETDGGVVEIRDSRGRHPLVFETKTEWFKAHETDRMLLSLESLKAVSAEPDYRYGGGHIKIKLKGHFQKHPIHFASLVNLFLNYEPILVHLMMHQRRTENARPLGLTRMSPEQLRAANLPWNSRTTLAQFLGEGLNEILNGKDCRTESSVRRRYDQEQSSSLSVKENCVLAWLAYFATDVVGKREMAINLQSWRGAANPNRLKEALELRFFNAPAGANEAELEEALVRGMADQAIRASTPVLYKEMMDPSYDLDSFYVGHYPERRQEDFAALLTSSGLPLGAYFDEYLDDEKWARRRSAY